MSTAKEAYAIQQFDSWFTRVPELRAAICGPCRTVVLPKAVPSHARKLHNEELNQKTRNWISKGAMALQAAGILAGDIADIRYPAPTDQAIPGLNGWHDGKKCIMIDEKSGEACGHIHRQVGDIQRHCRQAHGWKYTGLPGRRPDIIGAAGKGKCWVDKVFCQRLGQNGPLQRLFQVTPPTGLEDRGERHAPIRASKTVISPQSDEPAWSRKAVSRDGSMTIDVEGKSVGQSRKRPREEATTGEGKGKKKQGVKVRTRATT